MRDAEINEQLASWRSLVQGTAFSPDSPDSGWRVREHLARQRALFHDLVLDTLADTDGTFLAFEHFLEQSQRSPLHARYQAERSAFGLEVYERAVAEALRQAIKNGLEGLPREIIKTETVYVQSRVPKPKPWYQHILFGD